MADVEPLGEPRGFDVVMPETPAEAELRETGGLSETVGPLPPVHGDHMGTATLGWISGCVVIWSALFAIGNFLYGRFVYAGLLTLVFIISGAVLLYVINHLWDASDAAAKAAREAEIATP